MPNRILRDELLTSERWWSVSSDARTLWVSIVLSADDLGRCPGNPFTCRTKYLAGTISSPERVEKLVNELHDVDLIRIYQSEGARFFFVPRYRQFVRYTRSKYPEPPKEINDITPEKHFQSTAQATLKHPEVKRSEVKRREKGVGSSISPTRVGATPDFNPRLKNIPPETTPAQIERNRAIAQAVQAGDLDKAKRLRDEP